MPTTITFSAPLNVSCQVGDTAYYVPTTGTGGFTVNSSNVIEIGIITAINQSTPSVTIGTQLVNPPYGAFILFSKDNKANMSSALGYYARLKMRNNSTAYAELFSVGMDIFESSK